MKRRQTLCLHGGLAVIGGLGYTMIELLWRGRTHWSMFLVGGACFEIIGCIHTRLCRTSLLLRSAVCAAAVTGVELVSGCILNRWLRLRVWDYSGMRFNILGQVCLLYSVLWLFLSAAACPLYAVCRRLLQRGIHRR